MHVPCWGSFPSQTRVPLRKESCRCVRKVLETRVHYPKGLLKHERSALGGCDRKFPHLVSCTTVEDVVSNTSVMRQISVRTFVQMARKAYMLQKHMEKAKAEFLKTYED